MAPSDSEDEGQESKKERINRELIELLNELRVALPGVQVLFAFLLVLPVSQGFAKVDSVGRAIYFASLLAAAAASALLIAPSAYHRIHFRSGNKERILLTSNRLAIAGLAILLLAISGAIFVIANILFANAIATLVAAATAVWFAYFWFALPLSRERSEEETS